MSIILNRCDEDTRAEIALGSSCQDNLEAGELIKFLARVRTVCNNTDDADVFFGSRVTKITKHHLQPTTIVKELLAAHPTDDAIWDNANPCNVSLDNTSESEEPVNTTMTTTSIRSEDNSNTTQESIGSIAISMLAECDETW